MRMISDGNLSCGEINPASRGRFGLDGCHVCWWRAQARQFLDPAGISVGEIALGASRSSVQAIAGEPVSSLTDGDQYPDFVVHYKDDRVSEIIVTSARYRTRDGISVKTTPRQFLARHPKARITCSSESGATSMTYSKLYDAIPDGLAYGQDIFQGRNREVISTLTVHRRDVAVKVYGTLRPCRA